MDNFIQLFLAVTGGGGIGFILNYLINNRKTDQSEFEILINVWKEQNAELRAERTALIEREHKNSREILALREELSNLKSKMTILESAHFDLPLPQAVKDLDGTFVLVNNEFERIFIAPHGYNMKSCIGTDGVHIWGMDLMEKTHIKEKEVITTKSPKHFVEKGFDVNKNPTTWSTFRYPIYLGDRVIATGLLVLNKIEYETNKGGN